MQKNSLKNRIAYHYIISSALLIFSVFVVIYFIVRWTIYNNIDNDIRSEINKHLKEIVYQNGSFELNYEEEWEEREHNTFEVNPVFIQFLDSQGKVMMKSPNLKAHSLDFYKGEKPNDLFDAVLMNHTIRQAQVPIFHKGQNVGYFVIAMSLEDTITVLNNLMYIMILAYPIILILLYFIARIIAGRSISPVSNIIATSNIITKDNLNTRIELPEQKDELYILSATINDLLDRIEMAVEREKQFTSHASHELRTPLTVLKGTLEVLNRKPRTTEEYQQKIKFCIEEINRLDGLIDQLLLLARYENQRQQMNPENINLETFVLDNVSRFSQEITSKNISLKTDFQHDCFVETDNYLLTIILNNLFSNALKFSNEGGLLEIKTYSKNNFIFCQIKDSGRGIQQGEIEKVFNPFYRSKNADFPEVKGSGLGLSIVKKICELLQIEIQIESQINQGTTVSLIFSQSKS